MESSDSEYEGSDSEGDQGFPHGFFHQAGTQLPNINQLQVIAEDGSVEYINVEDDEDLVQLFQEILSMMDAEGTDTIQMVMEDSDYMSEDDSDYSEGDDGSLDTDLDYNQSEEESEEDENDDPTQLHYANNM